MKDNWEKWKQDSELDGVLLVQIEDEDKTYRYTQTVMLNRAWTEKKELFLTFAERQVTKNGDQVYCEYVDIPLESVKLAIKRVEEYFKEKE